MDAIIGRYRARMEETGLLLRHASGITFDLTVEETLGLLDLMNVYRQTLLALQQQQDAEPQTEPRMQSVTIKKE